MNNDKSSPFPELSLSRLDRIDQICEAFEVAWQASGRRSANSLVASRSQT